MRTLFVAAIALILGACCWCGSNLSRASPYGFWSTERGQTVEVFRNATFKYCDQNQCEWGKYLRDGVTMVMLVDFADMKVTERLRKLSGWEEIHDVNPALDTARTKGQDIGDGGVGDGLRFSLCQNRPCIIVGQFRSDTYRFVKLKDY